jgi:hypothetical protein
MKCCSLLERWPRSRGRRQSYNFLFKASGALFAASFTAVYRVLGQKADH